METRCLKKKSQRNKRSESNMNLYKIHSEDCLANYISSALCSSEIDNNNAKKKKKYTYSFHWSNRSLISVLHHRRIESQIQLFETKNYLIHLHAIWKEKNIHWLNRPHNPGERKGKVEVSDCQDTNMQIKARKREKVI